MKTKTKIAVGGGVVSLLVIGIILTQMPVPNSVVELPFSKNLTIDYINSPFGTGFTQALDNGLEKELVDDLGAFNVRTNLVLSGGYFPWNEELDWEKNKETLLEQTELGIIPTGTIQGSSEKDSIICHEQTEACWHDTELGLLKGKISTCSPCDEDEYSNYIKKVVEEFDGDGIDDDEKIKIKYWQLGDNEGDLQRMYPNKAKEYARTVQLTYKAMKSSCDDCKLVLMSAFFHVKSLLPEGECLNGFSRYQWTSLPSDSCAPKNIKKIQSEIQFVDDGIGDGYFYKLFTELNQLKQDDVEFSSLNSQTDTYFDSYAFHFYEHPRGYQALPDIVNLAEKTFDKFGYENIDIIIPEFSTYSGQPKKPGVQSFRHPDDVDVSIPKSLEQHANDVLKRHMVAIANGVDRVYYPAGIDVDKNDPDIGTKSLAWCSARDNYYCTATLLNPDGTKKPAYYGYQKMVEILDGSDWDKTEILNENKSTGFYLYKFVKEGHNVYVGWSETPTTYNFGSREFILVKKISDSEFENSRITGKVEFDSNPIYLIEE